MTSCFILARVSSSKQIEGWGLPAQVAACEAFAAAQGLTVEGIIQEPGVSGAAPLEKRPELLSLINSLQPGMVVLVAKRCRVARSVLNHAIIERMITKKKCSILSADGAGNGEDPSAELMRNILNAFSAFERAQIASRTAAALKQLKLAGKPYCRIPPFGKQRSDCGSLLEDNQEELQLLQEVLSWRAGGRSWSKCAAQLNLDGRMNRSGRPWSQQNLCAVVRKSQVA
jgi:DNA invertase Pin-like site-specific DNA recombinase